MDDFNLDEFNVSALERELDDNNSSVGSSSVTSINQLNTGKICGRYTPTIDRIGRLGVEPQCFTD